MIIGNNNFNMNNKNEFKEINNFNKKQNMINKNNENFTNKNPFVENINTMNHSDPTNKNQMRDKSLAMLQERLNNGSITLDEFNKKVNDLTKKRA